MKSASFSIAILNFFSRHGQYFHPTKDQPRTRPSSTFLYICYNFRQVFCTNIIQFFSVENMGHNQLQKCTKYHLVSLLNEKQWSTFANFWHLFNHVTLLTHSALNSKLGKPVNKDLAGTIISDVEQARRPGIIWRTLFILLGKFLGSIQLIGERTKGGLTALMFRLRHCHG